MKSAVVAAVMFIIAMSLIGCAGRPAVMPNPDPELRKPSTLFAADAVKRFPYPAEAPRGGDAEGRAQIGYMLDRIDVVNLSDQDWTDVDMWVNQSYVVHVHSMPKNVLKRLDFQMIYNDKGEYLPLDGNKFKVTKLELFRDGKMYDLTSRVAD